MDVGTVWQNLSLAIAAVQSPDGDYPLKLETVKAGVELLFEFPAEAILAEVEGSSLPTRATVSWLVFEGERLPDVDEDAVEDLRRLYESRCPPGQGIIAAPPGMKGVAS